MVSFKIHTAVLCCISFIVPAYCARILGVFPIDFKSHFGYHEAIMKSLLEAGHEVTLVSPFSMKHPHKNLTSVRLKTDRSNDVSSLAPRARPDFSWFSFMLFAIDVLEKDCYQTLSLKEMQDLKNFDVMFVEMLPMSQCYFQIAKDLGIPVIGTISLRSFFTADNRIGNPRNPSVFPAEFSLMGSKMTFGDRFLNFVDTMKIKILHMLERRKLKKFHNTQGLHTYQDMQRFPVSLVFANNHASILPRAMVPNSIEVGGIHITSTPLAPLPKHLKKFIDEAQHGVILLSLGSIATNDALNPAVRNILKKTFAKIPQRVIWKFDGEIEGLSDNVLLSKWLPQKEILAHKNVLAFISHSGLCSTYESIYFGKPMILLPVFIDQPAIAGVLSSLGVGLHLNILELTENKLSRAIFEIINNESYRQNVRELSRKFKDELTSPAEKIVYWTEYVIRHNGALHLRTSTSTLPTYQYLMLDIIAFVVLIGAFASIFFFFLTKLAFKILFSNFQEDDFCSMEKKTF